ncbi:MAG: hypothetical protein QG608_1115 [Actinomycetota bacterium]|nr:hypothetical protein [Actinomycetota bacterium]
MTLRFLGKDPDSPADGSPTIYDAGDSYVIQGWRVVDQEHLQAIGDIPAGETLIEIPKRMMQFFPEVARDHTEPHVR